MRNSIFLLALVTAAALQAQTVSNISCTSAPVADVLLGDFDPLTYAASTVIDDHADILCALRTDVSTDSLLAHLRSIESFGNRNSHSDTVSSTFGIGAARRWAFAKFQQFSAANEDRLLPAYLQFDMVNGPCGDGPGWRNVFAVMPGSDTTDHQVVFIEAHLDSRCADNCDGTCAAAGAEDNGSGTALVLELARVMSRFTFRHSIVFMLTTGEEQGLIGADAMAQYCEDEGVAVKAVLNNDIVGGILCGTTSSAPSCPAEADVDSLQLRIFSSSSSALPHRNLARTVKMFYEEKLMGQVPVPMTISVIGQEDRTGRGGDHIPFRARGYRSIRFTAANEHGDADVDAPGYHDRQHTEDDILGVDTDGDLIVDSLFIDLNYLARNTVINGMSATLLASGPETPTFDLLDEPTGLRVAITNGFGAQEFRIGVRNGSASLDFDAVYRTTATSFLVPGMVAGQGYFVSVSAIDNAGMMSPFSGEQVRNNDADTPPGVQDNLPYGIACAPIGIVEGPSGSNGIELLACTPNPFTGSTFLQVRVNGPQHDRQAELVITDIHGRVVHRERIALGQGLTSTVYQHREASGVYVCSLQVDGRTLATRRLVAH